MKGASFASLNSLLAPIFAVFLGWIVLQETLHWNVYLGGILILAGTCSFQILFYFGLLANKS